MAYTQKEILEIVDTTYKQLVSTTDVNVLLSWGITLVGR